jgi:DNA-directed RNA polymerase alpha subunit
MSDNTELPAYIASLPVTVLGLNTRTENALVRAGIVNIGIISQYGIENLCNIRNIGEKAVKEIMQVYCRFLEAVLTPENTENLHLLFPKLYTRSIELSDDALAAPVSILGLSNRTRNALESAGITNIHQLITYEHNLCNIIGIGVASIGEVEQALSLYVIDSESIIKAFIRQKLEIVSEIRCSKLSILSAKKSR